MAHIHSPRFTSLARARELDHYPQAQSLARQVVEQAQEFKRQVDSLDNQETDRNDSPGHVVLLDQGLGMARSFSASSSPRPRQGDYFEAQLKIPDRFDSQAGELAGGHQFSYLVTSLNQECDRYRYSDGQQKLHFIHHRDSGSIAILQMDDPLPQLQTSAMPRLNLGENPRDLPPS